MKTKHFIVLAILNIGLIASCKKADPLPTFDDVNGFYARNKSEGETHKVNVDGQPDTIVTAKGTEIIFPQGAFNKTGEITIKVNEILDPTELVLTNNPNSIDSTFNQNPVVLQINADVATLESGKVYKVTTPSKGKVYDRLSVGNALPWLIDPTVTASNTAPIAGNNTPLGIYNEAGKVSFTYNKLGTVAPSVNPWAVAGGKTKVKIKLYGYVNSPSVNTYVVQKDYNAVSAAKRLSDSEFITDSVQIGTKLHLVSICYNQSKKYVGFADAEVKDTLRVPISLFEVTSEQELKSKIQNYLAP